MSPRAAPLGALLRLNTHLPLNRFDEVTDAQAAERIVSQVNSMAFLAAHLIGGDPSTLGSRAFLVQHDSYHIGQLAMLRRVHGLPAMRYSAATR